VPSVPTQSPSAHAVLHALARCLPRLLATCYDGEIVELEDRVFAQKGLNDFP
jgi:hypothetical protein